MNCLLVLRINGESLAGYDAMVNLEEELIVELKGIAEVDGHDMGCGEINIFILVANPEAVFERAKPVLARRGLLANMRSGFRLLTEDDYTTIWPENSTEEFFMA